MNSVQIFVGEVALFVQMVIPQELFFVMFEGFAPSIAGKDRLFPEITHDIRDFSNFQTKYFRVLFISNDFVLEGTGSPNLS